MTPAASTMSPVTFLYCAAVDVVCCVVVYVLAQRAAVLEQLVRKAQQAVCSATHTVMQYVLLQY